MHRAGDILRGAMKRVQPSEQPLDWIVAVWPLAVGKRLATHARPLSLHKGRLEIGVDGAAWREQLQELEASIRREINHWWGKELVGAVNFVDNSVTLSPVRPGADAAKMPAKPPVPAQFVNEHTPFIRKGAQGRRK